MKVLFFFPRIENSFRASYAPLGIMSIASYLNANGHKAIICDRYFSREKLKNILSHHSPDIIGVSIMTQSFLKDAIKISKAAKAKGLPVVWGGLTASVIPKEALESGYVDYVSINEGEYTWLDIANAFDNGEDFDDIKALACIKNGKYKEPKPRNFVDLTTLPETDWSLVKPENYFQKSYGYNKMLSTYFSKGCSGNCTYCYNPNFNRHTRRCRTIKQVVDEMCYLAKEYGADGFDFTDDLMFANRGEVIDFCNEILSREIKFCWSGYLSVGILNEFEDYELMYKSGCRSIIYGIESGSERILRTVKKHLQLDSVKSNVNLCLDAGIIPITMFIIGLPGETESDLKKTVDLAKSLDGAAVACNYFTPLPGSQAYDSLVANSKIKKLTTLREHMNVVETEELFANVTEVDTIDLITIRKYIRLKGLVTKTGKSYKEQASKAILSTIKSWFGNGPIHFLKSSFNTIYNLLKTFTIFFHPKIRKKYNLYFLSKF